MKYLLFALLSAFLLGSTIFQVVSNKINLSAQQVDTSVLSKWNIFKAKFNKAYEDPDYEAYRIQVFALNLRIISSDTSGSLGITKFSDLTSDEFKETYLNAKIVNQGVNKANIQDAEEESDAVPNEKYINWVTQKKVTSVKNQYTCNSAWAFSTIGALESSLLINYLADWSINLSEQQLIDCVTSNQGCNGGTVENAYSYIESDAVTISKRYPYRDSQQTCKASTISDPLYSFFSFTTYDSGRITTLRSQILISPVTAHFDATEWQNYTGGTFYTLSCRATTLSQLNHSALVVGYENGNWIVKNSWGTNWGEKGYIYLPDLYNCGIALNYLQPNDSYRRS